LAVVSLFEFVTMAVERGLGVRKSGGFFLAGAHFAKGFGEVQAEFVAVDKHACVEEAVAVETLLLNRQLLYDAGIAVELGAVGTDMCLGHHIPTDSAGQNLSQTPLFLRDVSHQHAPPMNNFNQTTNEHASLSLKQTYTRQKTQILLI
jgi:hypothetical protein